jgi:hypothetical protein
LSLSSVSMRVVGGVATEIFGERGNLVRKQVVACVDTVLRYYVVTLKAPNGFLICGPALHIVIPASGVPGGDTAEEEFISHDSVDQLQSCKEYQYGIWREYGVRSMEYGVWDRPTPCAISQPRLTKRMKGLVSFLRIMGVTAPNEHSQGNPLKDLKVKSWIVYRYKARQRQREGHIG